MTPEQFQRAQEIFLAACEKPRGERTAYIDRACDGDAAIRQSVRSMLAHDEAPAITLESRVGRAVRELGSNLLDTGAEGETPAYVGEFRILRKLGAGGFGVVYLAEQRQPRRTVALKVLRAGVASPDALKRFEYEAHILGRLQHPGIAQVYQAGFAGVGAARQAFLALEHIHGRNLLAYAAQPQDGRPRLNTSERLELFARVLDALQHAHQNGVIHRDLKPDNILVAERDAAGALVAEPKLLDFGVARVISGECDLTRIHTSAGQLVGTLAYMSPEQVSGNSAGVDTRCDIYSAGVVLYELLTGRLPYDVRGRPIAEAIREICDARAPSIATTNRLFRGDVETIVAKMMEKDPVRRYQSAAAVAADIRRHLSGEPIEARRDSALYVLRKNLRRYRGFVTAASLLVIAFSVMSATNYLQSQRNAELARVATEQRSRADAESAKLRRSLYYSRIGYSHAAMLTNDASRVAGLLDQCPEDLRGWEWRFLWRLADRSMATISTPGVGPGVAAMSADGRRLVTLHVDGSLRVFDVPNRRLIRTGRGPAIYGRLAISRDGAQLAFSDGVGCIWLYGVDDGEPRGAIETVPDRAEPLRTVDVRDLDFAPDGVRLAAACHDGYVRIWDSANGGLIQKFAAANGSVSDVRFSPDGRWIVTVGLDGVVRRWPAAAPARGVALGKLEKPEELAISPDSSLVAAASSGRELCIWHLESGDVFSRWRRSEANTPGLAFSADSQRLISSGSERTVHVWDAATGEALDAMRGHRSLVSFCFATPDGQSIISGGFDRDVKFWPAQRRPDVPVIQDPQRQAGVAALSPDGRWLAFGSDRRVRLYDLDTLRPVWDWAPLPARVNAVCFSPDGERIYASTFDEALLACGLDGRATSLGRAPGRVSRMIAAPDGRTMALVIRVDHISVWRMGPGGGPVREVDPGHGETSAIALSPDGTLLATAGKDRFIRLWHYPELDLAHELLGEVGGVRALAFDARGERLAGAGEAGIIRIWSVARNQPLAECSSPVGTTSSIQFSPDGNRILGGGSTRTLRIWDAHTGEEALTLPGHDQPILQVMLARDGRRLVTCDREGAIRLWETE